MRNPWFRWFAWHPTWTTDRGWRWLRPVWRRHVPPILIPGAVWTFDNRVALPADVENTKEGRVERNE